MKKKTLIFMLVLLVFTATACGSKDKKEATVDNNTNTNNPVNDDGTDKTIDQQVQNATEQKQEDISFADIKISEFGATNIVSGKATNNSSDVRNVRLNLKMYNTESGQLLGRVSTELTDLQPNETRDFEIRIMGDFSTVNQFKVEVENL